MRNGILLLAVLYAVSAFSQESPNVKFGKVTVDDLTKRSYPIDTGAVAVVLYDNGITKIKGNAKGWFSLEFKIFRRIQILNKNGYRHATVEIPIYTNGEDEEKLDDLKASTYNLENGKVVETKLEKNGIFKEKINKNLVVKKFTLPNVREGSIIEYEFQITSDFLFNLQPWAFQSDIPKLWSEYRVTMPQFLTYTLISQGNRTFYIYDHQDKNGNFMVDQQNEGPYGMSLPSDKISITCGITEFRWAMKDVPAMKEEAYTSTTDNYVAKLEFQLAGYTAPLVEQKVMTTWPDLADRLLKRDDFGMQLDDALNWLPAMVTAILQGASTETEKAKKIYTYVRDQFTCTDHNVRYTEQSLKNVFKNRNGNVAEINLLLTAMLRSVGLNADPVILSTKENGFVYPNYPLIGRFNYVIARVTADGKDLLLDASYPQLGFAKLDYDCYNGQARVVNAAATDINLNADQLIENETVTVNLMNDKSEGWTGKINDQRGYYGSMEIRQQIKKQGQEAFFKDMAKDLSNDVTIGQPSIDSLNRYDEPLALHYDIKFGKEQPDIIYLDPIIAEKYKHNPFKSASRQYPVEMPYKINETYVLTITIPDGYVADEMPKPFTLKMDNSNDAVFEYNISRSGNYINLLSRLQVNRTLFQPSEYNGLREFFNRIVAKQNEQIVFKKKS